MRKLLLPVVVALLMCGISAAVAALDFGVANNLYEKGDFKGARAGYEALVQSGGRSAHLFYNLGNAAYREGDKGAAMLAYERALALEPGHPDAKANLRFLQGETGAKLPVLPWFGRALSWPAGNEAAWIAAGAFWGLCFSLVPLWWKGRIAAIPAVFCCLALAWSGAILGWQYSRGEQWIVTAEAAKARTTPVDSAPVAAALPMGSQVQLLLDRGPWLYVQMPDDARGWINRDALNPVRLK